MRSDGLVFYLRDPGDYLKEETLLGYKLRAILLEHNKTHCTEPTLISTLTVLPPILNITENLSPFTVLCEVVHTSLSYSINATTQRHHKLTGKRKITVNG